MSSGVSEIGGGAKEESGRGICENGKQAKGLLGISTAGSGVGRRDCVAGGGQCCRGKAGSSPNSAEAISRKW